MSSRVTLKSLIEESKDGEWGKGEPFDHAVEMAVIRGTDFADIRVGHSTDLPVRFIPDRIAARKTIKPLDILIETAGGSKERPTGRTVLIKSSLVSKSTVRLTCASFARFIRLNPRKVYAPYVFWVLQNMYNQGVMRQYNTQHTGVSRFQFTTFAEREPICLPPLDSQRHIADSLSTFDDLIENNTRRIKILEQMAQMLYREWFVKFRFPGHQKVRMVKSKSGLIPQGWGAVTIGDLCDDVRRSVDPSVVPANTPYIGLEHMPRQSIALSEWGEAGQVQSTKLRFNCGDILFGKIRPYFHKVGVAPIDGVCSSDAIVIVPKQSRYSSVVLLCASSDDFVRQAVQTSQGTKMPRANWGVLARYPIALPETPLVDRFNHIVEPMIELLNNLLFHNRCLRKTRELLLPKLVSGEISVEQIEAELSAQTV